MTRSFYDALREALDMTGRSLKAVCQDADVSYEQFKKYMQRGARGEKVETGVDDAVKIARALGLTVDEMIHDENIALRAEFTDIWRSMTREDQEGLLAVARRHLNNLDAQG